MDFKDPDKMECPCICPLSEEPVELDDSIECDWCRKLVCKECVASGISGENICVECKEHR